MEYRRRCKVCGHIWCYTDADKKESNTNATLGAINAIGQLASAFGGNVFTHSYYANQADRYKKGTVDYTKCPNCHSSDTEYYDGKSEKKTTAPVTVKTPVAEIHANATPESLLKRAALFLEDKQWDRADAYAEACLDLDPENAQAYLCKLLAKYKLTSLEALPRCHKRFEFDENYKKALRFADSALAETLRSAAETVRERKLEERYQTACREMENAKTEEAYLNAAGKFSEFGEYKDSVERMEICAQNAETLRKETIYNEAMAWMGMESCDHWENAEKLFVSLGDWKDSAQLAQQCTERIREAREREKLAAQRREEERRQQQEQALARQKRIKAIAIPVAAVLAVVIGCVAFVNGYMIPKKHYDKAMELWESSPVKALTYFSLAGDYKGADTYCMEYYAMLYNKQWSTGSVSENGISMYHSYFFSADKTAERHHTLAANMRDDEPTDVTYELVFEDSQIYLEVYMSGNRTPSYRYTVETDKDGKIIAFEGYETFSEKHYLRYE